MGLFNESEFIAFRCILVLFRKEPAFLLDFVGEDPIALILSNLVGDFRMVFQPNFNAATPRRCVFFGYQGLDIYVTSMK